MMQGKDLYKLNFPLSLLFNSRSGLELFFQLLLLDVSNFFHPNKNDC